MRGDRPEVGSVIQIPLPDGRYGYGRVLKEVSIAVYKQITAEPNQPPIGSRDYLFIVAVHNRAFSKGNWSVVGHDAAAMPQEDEPPPQFIEDPITGRMSIYAGGTVRPAQEGEWEGLERAAVWESNHVVDRIMNPEACVWIEPPRTRKTRLN
jgi:hypothetical protein